MSSLFEALQNGQLEVALRLIEQSADVNWRSAYGDSPLHMASFAGYLQIARQLIAKGANVNATDHYGRTPLSLGQANGSIGQILRQAGARR